LAKNANTPRRIRKESGRNPRGLREDSQTFRVDSLVPVPVPVPVPLYVPFSDRKELVQRSRTSPPAKNPHLTAKNENGRRRLLAKVLRDVLDADRFATSADLLDAFKYRLARLGIRYEPDDVHAAIRLVESNTPTLNPWRPHRG
jgi:hypothetical protein